MILLPNRNRSGGGARFFQAVSLWTAPEKLRLSQAAESYRCARSKLSTRSLFGRHHASSVAEPWSYIQLATLHVGPSQPEARVAQHRRNETGCISLETERQVR